MVELPPEVQRMLEAARRGHDPSVADYERVRQGLSAALGAQAAPGQTGGSESSVASTGSSTLGTLAGGMGGKVLLVAALMGGAGGVWTWHSRSESRGAASSVAATRAPAPPAEPAPQPSVEELAEARAELGSERHEAPEVAHRARADVYAEIAEIAVPRGPGQSRSARGPRAARSPAPRQAFARAHESDHEQPARAQASEDPAPRVRPQRAASETAAPAAPAEQAASVRVPAATEVARERVKPESEVALIREALASLNANDAQRALELVDAYGLRYPLGGMGRERAGLRVLALCALGRVQEGRREQAAFLEAGSDSPLQNRVRRACEAGAEAPDSVRASSSEPRR
jgi:hypothetical protein